MITSSRLSQNCYGVHKFNHKCAVRYTKTNSVRAGAKNLSAHFLRCATMGANLTQKMSELEVIEAVGGHYRNYIQRALLSANAKTKQES